MPPKFPLQARFAACLSTIILLIVLYFILSSPRFAYAVDVDSIIHEDHNHRVIRDSNVRFSEPRIAGHVEMLTDNVTGHAVLARRAPEGVDSLTNNVPKLKNIQMGETHHWVIPKSVVTGPKSPVPPGLPKTVEIKQVQPKPALDEESMQEQRKRNEEVSRRTSTVYVTLNTCIQPILNATQRADDSSPPQLQLFYSQDGSVKDPGPNTPNILSVNFDDGYASVKINAAGDIYIGVFAPTHPRYGGIYNYEVAASIDAPFHSAEQNTPFLYFVDSDSNAALLQTNNLTSASAGESSYEEWMKLDPPPFTLFAHNMNHSAILGIQKSFCGLSKNAQINRMGGSLQVKMTNRSMHPREQFYITNLNRTSSYYGIIAMEGNSTASGSGVVGGGGKVWKAMNFTTKSGKFKIIQAI
ncbi:hypothetical protein LOZ66_000505 [Ophidiomyces ophidiicola]|nr:hypothetical protein LOZ65_000707 [Ophidiomyces ophidiicola]KAI1943918.1 hypothetical protein LOZ66_000505 [Ophidiomyces ophidiicola]